MKKIKVKDQNRGAGLMRLNDDIWANWIDLDGGTISENAKEFILTDTKGRQYKAEKEDNDLIAAMHNPHIEVDKKLFHLYVGQDSSNVYFILYNFKDASRGNEYVISSLGGLMSGSSINFETI